MGFGGLVLQPLAGVALMVVLGTRAAPLLIGQIILSYVLFRIKKHGYVRKDKHI
jgi:hypothetical protein